VEEEKLEEMLRVEADNSALITVQDAFINFAKFDVQKGREFRV